MAQIALSVVVGVPRSSCHVPLRDVEQRQSRAPTGSSSPSRRLPPNRDELRWRGVLSRRVPSHSRGLCRGTARCDPGARRALGERPRAGDWERYARGPHRRPSRKAPARPGLARLRAPDRRRCRQGTSTEPCGGLITSVRLHGASDARTQARSRAVRRARGTVHLPSSLQHAEWAQRGPRRGPLDRACRSSGST